MGVYGTKESRIVEVLRSYGYSVLTSHIKDGKDFLKYKPTERYDLIVTNPPFSIKNKFLQRAFDLQTPFMFLLPITTLEGVRRNKMFKENVIQLLIPNWRFNFISEKSSGAWFQTSWFTYGLGLEKDLNFITLNDKTQPSSIADNGMSVIQYYDQFRQVA